MDKRPLFVTGPRCQRAIIKERLERTLSHDGANENVKVWQRENRNFSRKIPMPHKTLRLNGLKIHLNSWGSAKNPPLFLLHGWMDIGKSFEFIAEHLQDKYYLLAPDLRGFGRSEHAKNPLGYHFFEYLADVHALFNALSPAKPARVLGHSMGGNILSLYAGVSPERVSHFVNVEGFGIADMPSERGPDLVRTWLEQIGQKKKFRTYKKLSELAQKLILANPRLEADKALFLAKHLSRKVPGGYRITSDPRHKWKNPYLYQMRNVAAYWQRIQAKCLLVAGENTRMDWLRNPESVQEEIQSRAKNYPAGTELVFIKDAGHMVHHEKPAELARLVENFLSQPATK